MGRTKGKIPHKAVTYCITYPFVSTWYNHPTSCPKIVPILVILYLVTHGKRCIIKNALGTLMRARHLTTKYVHFFCCVIKHVVLLQVRVLLIYV